MVACRGESSSSQAAAAAALVSEEGLFEVPVLDWNTAKKMKRPLPPRAPPAPSRSALSAALDVAIEKEVPNGHERRRNSNDHEYKMLRRTVSNRLAARKSRKKRFTTISQNETRRDELKVVIGALKPQVEALAEKKKILLEENILLQAAFQARAIQSEMAKKTTDQLRLEIASLKQNLAVVSKNKDNGHVVQINPEEVLVQPQPQPQPQLYSIDFNQQMPENAHPQPQLYSIDFNLQQMPENAHPQPQLYSIDFNQQMPENAHPQPQLYSIDFYQQMPQNAQPQPYSIDFYDQQMPENSQPQPFSIDFYQKILENAQPQPQTQTQPYSIDDFYQQILENAQPQPPQQQTQLYSIDFYQQILINAQPQPQTQYSIDFYQQMPNNAQPLQPDFFEGVEGADDELEVDQYLNLDGGGVMHESWSGPNPDNL